jgi:hypothetical protein
MSANWVCIDGVFNFVQLLQNLNSINYSKSTESVFLGADAHNE